MKKQSIDFFQRFKTGLLVLVLFGFWLTRLPAQKVYQHYVDNDSQHFYDIKIPTGYKYLYLEAKGGDGGNTTWTVSGQGVSEGGQGATVTAFAYIGGAAEQLQPGSTLRLIPGQAGQSRLNIGGGGGGTGILFKSTYVTHTWQILMVAGGGGGAGTNRYGNPGTSTKNGAAGGSTTGNGGTDGDGGGFGDNLAFPGGGALSDGAGGCPGRAGFQNDEPVGGMGGTTDCGKGDYSVAGGFGFGGGGAGLEGPHCLLCNDVDSGGGGGGGGYSGGGGGYSSPQGGWEDHPYGGGGGGGSYTNPVWMHDSYFISSGTTGNAQNGYIAYTFSNTPPLRSVHLSSDQTKCLEKNDNTINGGNILLNTCSSGNTAQRWAIQASEIRFLADPTKCVDLSNGSTADATNIRLWGCNGTSAQNWIYDTGTRNIRSQADFRKCFDLGLGHVIVGNIFWLNTCNDNSATQKWVVDGVPSSIPSGANTSIAMAWYQDKCVDVANSITANGTNIHLWDCNGTSAQQFFYDGRTIRLKSAPSKCIDLYKSQPSDGANIQLYECNGTYAQQWIYDGFLKSFRSVVDINKCMDVDHSNLANGTNIQLWGCNGSNAQQFVMYSPSSDNVRQPSSITLATSADKCIDDKGSNTANGTNIQLYQCQDSPAQQWIAINSSVRLMKDLSKCIDLTEGNTANGTNVQLWSCGDGNRNQAWIYDVANQNIRSGIDFNKCLDLRSSITTNGNNIQLWDCNNTDAQRWILDGIPSAMPTGSNKSIRMAALPSKCVNIARSGTANGTNIELFDCNDSNAQHFLFDGRAIKMQSSPNKCLDLNQSSDANGTNIQLFDCNGTKAQQWVYDGFLKALRSMVNINKCMDVYIAQSGSANGTNIRLWDCNATDAQRFVIGQ